MDRNNDAAHAAVRDLQTERNETLQWLLSLDDPDCRLPVVREGRTQTVNQVLRAFSSHVLDHQQHLVRLLQGRGYRFREAALLLAKANAALAEFEALVLALDNEEFEMSGPATGDWSARQVLAHVVDTERRYRDSSVSAVGE
jgi:uncharacterized damage-inducible protein DinB